MKLKFHQNKTFFFEVEIKYFHLERLPLMLISKPHTNKTSISTAQRYGFTTETIILPFVRVLWLSLTGVGKDDPENRAIPGSICVVIHCSSCLWLLGEAAGVATS